MLVRLLLTFKVYIDRTLFGFIRLHMKPFCGEASSWFLENLICPSEPLLGFRKLLFFLTSLLNAEFKSCPVSWFISWIWILLYHYSGAFFISSNILLLTLMSLHCLGSISNVSNLSNFLVPSGFIICVLTSYVFLDAFASKDFFLRIIFFIIRFLLRRWPSK